MLLWGVFLFCLRVSHLLVPLLLGIMAEIYPIRIHPVQFSGRIAIPDCLRRLLISKFQSLFLPRLFTSSGLFLSCISP